MDQNTVTALDDSKINLLCPSSVKTYLSSILNDLKNVSTSNIEQYEATFENIYKAYTALNERETNLTDQCFKLNAKLTSQTQSSIQAAQEYNAKIDALRKEIDSAWDNVDKANERERRSSTQISKLRDGLLGLEANQERSQKDVVEKDLQVAELKDRYMDLEKQFETQKQTNAGLNERLKDQIQIRNKVQDDCQSLQKKIVCLEEALSNSKNERERDMRLCKKIENQLAMVQESLHRVQNERDSVVSNESILNQKVNALERKSKENLLQIEEKENNIKHLNKSCLKASDDVKYFKGENQKLHCKLKELEFELSKMNGAAAKLDSDKVQLQRKIDFAQTEKISNLAMIDELKTSLSLVQGESRALCKEIEILGCRDEETQRKVQLLLREKSVNYDKIHKIEEKVKKSDSVVKRKNCEMKLLEREILLANDEKVMIGAQQRKVEAKYTKAISEAVSLKEKVAHTELQLKGKEMQLNELQRCIQGWQSEFNLQKKELDEIRNDRNHLAQQLKLKDGDGEKLRQEVQLLRNQIKNLGEEIIAKDSAYMKACYEHHSVRSRTDQFQREITYFQKLVKANDDAMEQKCAEIKQLVNIKNVKDKSERMHLKKFTQLLRERDVLGTQLLRKKEANALLSEKVLLQSDMLSRGEIQYKARLNDIRILRLKLKDTMRVLKLIKKENGFGLNLKKLNAALMQKKAEVIQEKAKVAILSNELENPMNIHRWRQLEGNDPSTMELIQKVSNLQRRLIIKTEQAFKRDKEIDERTKELDSLKLNIEKKIKSNSGKENNEDQDRIKSLSRALAQKSQKLLAQTGELAMYERQNQELNDRLANTLKELHAAKQKCHRLQLEQNMENRDC